MHRVDGRNCYYCVWMVGDRVHLKLTVVSSMAQSFVWKLEIRTKNIGNTQQIRCIYRERNSYCFILWTFFQIWEGGIRSLLGYLGIENLVISAFSELKQNENRQKNVGVGKFRAGRRTQQVRLGMSSTTRRKEK